MSEKITFLYNNNVRLDDTVITGGDENAQFPASNLKNYFSTKIYRSNSASDNIVFDFGSAMNVDTVAIRGHLRDGLQATSFILEAHTSDSWGAPSFTDTFTLNEEFNLGYKFLAATQNYRYWRVSGTGSSQFELGNIFLGEKFQAQRNISTTFKFENRDGSSYSDNEYGQRFVDERVDQKLLSGKLNLIDKNNVDEMFTFIDYVGKKKPFWVILDPDEVIMNDSERIAGLFMFRARPIANHVFAGTFNFTLTMEGIN